MAGFGGSVFLADLDADFISPSQACVNPLFNGTSKTKEVDKKSSSSDNSMNVDNDGVAIDSNKKSGAATLSIDSSIFSGIDTVVNNNKDKVARVTLNDCLACSGCVTSAETVLVTSHSISKLKAILKSNEANSSSIIFVLSVSPHARVSIAEHFHLDVTTAQQHLESIFKEKFGFHYVFDTAGATQIAREEVAAEFLHRLNKTKNSPTKKGNSTNATTSTTSRGSNKTLWKRPRDTVAISSSEAIYVDTTEKYFHKHSVAHQPLALPLLTSSCPGWICYAEKKCPEVIPYLSTCKSPQQILGRIVKGFMREKLINKIGTNDDGNNNKQYINDDAKTIYHVTLMPCYDKKLEASRKDFLYGDRDTPDVDLVVTPKEFIDMLKSDGIAFKSVTLMDVDEKDNKTHNNTNNNINNVIKDFLGYEQSQIKTSQYDKTISGSSGGYLDYVLRSTALKLYDMNLFDTKYKIEFKTGRNKDFKVTEIVYNDKVVLRFAIAYGFRNIQAIVRQLKKGTCKYDFIEMMACPSGCLNGGAQIVAENRILTKALLGKVKILHDKHVVVDSSDTSVPNYHKIFNMQPYTNTSLQWFHTTYHSVAELKLETAMGGDW